MSRLSRRQRSRWFFWRYDQLLIEGFSPEEAALIANTKISAKGVRELRKHRKRTLQRYMDSGFSRSEAMEEIMDELNARGDAIIDWDTFRRILYGKTY